MQRAVGLMFAGAQGATTGGLWRVGPGIFLGGFLLWLAPSYLRGPRYHELPSTGSGRAGLKEVRPEPCGAIDADRRGVANEDATIECDSNCFLVRAHRRAFIHHGYASRSRRD